MNLIKQDSNTEITILTPECHRCHKIMDGFFYEFYKDPSFSMTEIASSFFWTKIWFQCARCFTKIYMHDKDLDLLNSYPLDMVTFPPGFNSKNVKAQRIASK